MPENKTSQLTYKTNALNTKLVHISFGLYTIFVIFLTIIALIPFTLNSFSAWGLLNKAQLTSLTKVYGLLGIASSILYLLCAIFFLSWLYRANSNARYLHDDYKFEFTPRLATLSFILPFYCYYGPYKAINEIWKNCKFDFNLIEPKKSRIITIWWVFFLIASILSIADSRLPITPANFILLVKLELVINISSNIAALSAIYIVKNIQTAQLKLIANSN